MENLDPNKNEEEKLVIPFRGSLEQHRGYDVGIPEGFGYGSLRSCKDQLFNNTSQIAYQIGKVDCFVTKKPGDPKIILQESAKMGAPYLIGDTPDYKKKHGELLLDLSKKDNEFLNHFFAIVYEIVNTFKNMIASEPDKIKKKLRSSRGFRISLNFLQNSLSIESAPFDGAGFLPQCQKVFADKRDAYLKLLERYIKKILPKELLEEHECFNISIGDDYSDKGKFAQFTIVTEQKSPDTTTLP